MQGTLLAELSPYYFILFDHYLVIVLGKQEGGHGLVGGGTMVRN